MFKMATCADCNEIVSGAFSGDLDRCPTKAEIEATGVLKVAGNYADNQLVNLADISANLNLSITPNSYTAVTEGATFTLNITCNTSWEVTYPTWCNGTTSGTGDASIRVSVASNSGPQRTGNIVITTSGPSQTLPVSQGGKPEIEVYVGDLSSDGTYCDIEATQPLKDELSVEISIVANGNTSKGSVQMLIGARQTRCDIFPPVPDGAAIMSKKINNVNGHSSSPFETDNAVYKWI